MSKILIVTGAGSGIGKQICMDMSCSFDKIILIGKSKLKLQKVKKYLIEKKINTDKAIIICSCDLAKETAITKIIKSLDVVLSAADNITLVNNAAVFDAGKNFTDSNSKEWARYFAINLMGPVNLTRKVLVYMKKKSIHQQDCHCIINIASTAGSSVVKGLSAYGSLKAALIYWSKTIALELGSKGVRVNVVAPGLIDTPIHSFYSEKNKNSKAYQQANAAQTLNRIGQATDVVDAVKYLHKSPWVTGSVVVVDGGISI